MNESKSKNSKRQKDNQEKIAGSSNSPLGVSFLIPPYQKLEVNQDFNPKKEAEKISCSIDRITIVAPIDVEVFERTTEQWQLLPFVKTADGGFQFLEDAPVNSKEKPEQVAYVEMPKHQLGKIRVDFNPNHSMTGTVGGSYVRDMILARLPGKHFSRIDVAIDVLEHDELEFYQVWTPGISKSLFYGKSGHMETSYWGKQKSEQQIRLYNKAVEQRVRHHVDDIDYPWWRLELQLRGSKIERYPELVAKALADFYPPSYSSPLLTESEQNKVARLMIDPGYLGKQTKQGRNRLRKVLRKAKPAISLSTAMEVAFKRDMPKLEKTLENYLKEYDIDRSAVPKKRKV